MPQLSAPDPSVRESFCAAMAEFAAEGRGGAEDQSSIGNDLRTRAGLWATEAGFQSYVDLLLADLGTDPSRPLPEGRVPCTTLWWVEGTEYLGRIAVRHHLNAELRRMGGHIGYDVRPSARRRGHGTAMLRAVLPTARALGIVPSALLTINPDNVASRRTTEANGGVLAEISGGWCHYWVPTA